MTGTPSPAARALWPLTLALLLSGCGSLVPEGGYLRDRLEDAADILDYRVGTGGIGVGAKVEATDYTGVAAGAGVGYHGGETYGRGFQSDLMGPADKGYQFLGIFGLFGVDGPDLEYAHPGRNTQFSVMGIQIQDPRPHTIDRFRLGGQVLLPGVEGGLYLNVGQVFDLVLGLFTLDIGNDDGVERTPRKFKKDDEGHGGGGGHH